jgi:hypothetical protein
VVNRNHAQKHPVIGGPDHGRMLAYAKDEWSTQFFVGGLNPSNLVTYRYKLQVATITGRLAWVLQS